MPDPIDTIREALNGPSLEGDKWTVALAALTEVEQQLAARDEALSILNGIDYDEGSRVDQAVRVLEGQERTDWWSDDA
jgi:hypothetical protein